MEITLLESEFVATFTQIPALIDHIEAGNREGFERFIPFPCELTTCTNIWTKGTMDISRDCFKVQMARREARRQRRAA